MALASNVLTDQEGRFELRGVPEGRLSLLANAGGHHGRLVGGIEVKPSETVEVPEIDLGPTSPGESPRLELIGIGAALAMKDGVLVLGKVFPGGGAARAGLSSGQSVVSIDGVPVAGMGLGGAVQRIRGAENTVVTLRVRQTDGRESDVHVSRVLVRTPPP